MTDPADERTRRRGPSRPGADPGAGHGSSKPARPAKPGKGGKAGKSGKGSKPGKTAQPLEAERSRAEPPVRGPGGRWPMADRSVLPTVLGVPPAAAVGLAAALTAVGVLVDLARIGGLEMVFTICYVSGCVLAVAWVRRSGIFGPIVQPPLLVALSVPAVVLLAGSPRPGQGVTERLLVIGAPLVNAFPVMASTTGAVLLVGLLRVVLQRP